MTLRRIFFRGLCLSASLVLISCSSTVQKVALPSGIDPQPKIVETENRLNEDRTKQFDLMSPKHFKDAQTSLAEAHKRSEKGESSAKILDSVGEAMAHLQAVEDNGNKYSGTFSTVLTARTFAKNVKAETAVPTEFGAADKQFKNFGDEIEGSNFRPDAGKISALEGRYSDVELAAVKATNLGAMKALNERASKEGAKDKAPETFTAAQVRYDSAARAIEANRRNPDGYKPAVELAMASSQKLTQVLRTVIDAKTPEPAAIQLYDQHLQLAATQASLKTAENRERNDHRNIQALEGENQQYAEKEALNQKIEKVKSGFRPTEAEVMRDGNKIVIRLKSMQFSTARFEFAASSLDTLQKVKEMISIVPVAKVVVEGHTDSVGTQKSNVALSQKRAEAVKQYFISEKTLAEDQVVAKGYGDEKPLSSNKTKEGRAVNRRVDVVIETTENI